jgi:hypothetical protein
MPKAAGSDGDKGLQALMELQEKLAMHSNLGQMVRRTQAGSVAQRGVRAVQAPSTCAPSNLAAWLAPSPQVTQQLQRAKLTHRRTQLTLQELSQVGASAPTYKQVGRA